MIKTPYNSACVTPCARLADFLVKKLTVRGTIGKMQGMKNAKNPPMTPAINIPHKDLLSSRGLLSTSPDRKSTRLNSSHVKISYAVFCLKKKKRDNKIKKRTCTHLQINHSTV